MKNASSAGSPLVTNIRYFVAMACIVSAWLFPFSAGPWRDASQQIHAVAMFSVAALCIGTGAIHPLATATTLAAIVLIAVAPHPYWGGKIAGCAGLLLGLVGCQLGSRLKEKPSALAWALLAIAAAALINAAEGLLQWLGLATELWPWVVDAEHRGVAFGALRQRNLFATFLCVGLICTVWLAYLRRISESLAWFFAVLLVFAIAASGSRTGVIELASLALAGWFWRRQQPVAVTRLLIGQLMLYGMAAYLLPIVAHWHGFDFSSSIARAQETGQYGRITLWRNALDLVRERPWSGWGWLDLGYGHYETLFEPRHSEFLSHAHNLILQIAVEFGVPIAALVLFALLLAVFSGKPWRIDEGRLEAVESGHERAFSWAILGVIVGVHSMLELPLWHAGFLFLTGLAIGHLLPPGNRREYPGKRILASPWLPTAIATTLILLALVAWHQYGKVLAISRAPFNARGAQIAAINGARDAWLFRPQVEFASLGLMDIGNDNAREVREMSEQLLHFSAEPHVIRPLLFSLWLLGENEPLRFHAERFCRAFPAHYQKWKQEHLSHPMLGAAASMEVDCQTLDAGPGN